MSSADVAASPPPPVNPADADERERLMAQLLAVMRLKRGAVENRNSVVGCAIATYQHVLDGVIADVAVELHRALALGLDTLDSVEQRVPPSASVIAGFEAAAKAQADAAARADGENLAPAHPAPPPDKVGKGTRDIYGRLGGASKEPAECPLCVQRVAAARFAQHLERCMGRGRVAPPTGVAAPSRSRGGVASRPRFFPRPAPQRAPHAPQPPTGLGLVKVKKTAKTKRISALLGAGAGLGSVEEGDDDDVPLSEMFADAAKVPGRAGAKANKIKLATTGKRDKKTAGTGTGTTGTGTGTGAKSRRGKKTAAAAPSDPFAGGMMIPFDDVGDFGDFDGFDGADGDDPFDLNFDIELDDGDLPGMAFQTDRFPSSARVAVAAKPAKKKRTATAPGGRGGRGGRAGSGRGGRGVAPGAATDVSEMVSGTFPVSPYDAAAAANATNATAGAGARGGRGGRGGRGAAVKPTKPRASKAAKERDAAGGASNAKASASVPAGAKPRKKPFAATTTKKGKTATTTTVAAAADAGARPSDALDAVFGDPTGGDGFGGGVADEDLELLFDADQDGGTTGGGDARMVDDEFGNLFG
jgi:hypothetical protein